MFISNKNQVICFLLIVLSLSSLCCQEVLATRYLKDMEEVAGNYKPEIWKKNTTAAADSDGGFVATINREVPSSPDPLHNRRIQTRKEHAYGQACS